MSSTFAGVSVLAGGELCPSTKSSVVTRTNWGYHLLVVQDYSRTKQATPTGVWISSRPFMVGGHEWCIEYYPNGCTEDCADFISLFVNLVDDDVAEEPVKAKFNVSFIDEAEKHKPTYISEAETLSFHPDSPMGYNMLMEKNVLEQSAHLTNGCFTIRCDIMVFGSEEDAAGAKVLLPEIDQHLSNLLQTKAGADVTFEVGGEMFAAHRCVLAARSKVFMAQLFGTMKEGATTSSVIQIKDMEAKVFRALLSFIYTDSLPKMEDDNMEEDEAEAVEEGQEEEATEDEMSEVAEQGQSEKPSEAVQWLQGLLVAADRYDLQRLRFICERQLSLRIGVSSVASTLALAEQHHCRPMKAACLKFIQVQSPSCLQIVMATGGWEHLITTYPFVLNELFAMCALNQK